MSRAARFSLFREFAAAGWTRTLSGLQQVTENPYESPQVHGAVSQRETVQRHESYLDAAKAGALFGGRWAAWVFGPLLGLLALFVVGIVLYEGVWKNDWSMLTRRDDRSHLLDLFWRLPLAFIGICGSVAFLSASMFLLQHFLSCLASKPTDLEKH